jgi:hypothetical protein
MIARLSVEACAVPPNQRMELTDKSVTPFARRRAKGAPLLSAAHAWRYAAGEEIGAGGSIGGQTRGPTSLLAVMNL